MIMIDAWSNSASLGDATVYIIDDNEDIHAVLTPLLESVRLRVESYLSAADFISKYAPEVRRGCIISDFCMPGMSGKLLQERLNQMGSTLPVIFISGHAAVSMVVDVMKAGAVDFIEKPFSPPTLLHRVQQLLQGVQPDSVAAMGQVLDRHSLTSRERQIAILMADGYSSKEIARRLLISAKTVDNHRAKVFEKMKVDNAVRLRKLLGA